MAKSLRWRRFLYPQRKVGLIVPMDHGLTMGPIDGLRSVNETAGWIRHQAITGIIVHKGVQRRLSELGLWGSAGCMVHLNGMSTLGATPDKKEMLTSVESAMRLGAEGVSLQVNFDGQNDAHNLRALGIVVDRAQEYGLPVLAMVYDKVASNGDRRRIERLRHLMRITIELGADAIKIGMPTTASEIPTVLDGLCDDIAVFFAGGSLCSEETLVELTQEAVRAGAAGLCVGRNIFQRPNPAEILTKLGQALWQGECVAQPTALPTYRRSEHGVH